MLDDDLGDLMARQTALGGYQVDGYKVEAARDPGQIEVYTVSPRRACHRGYYQFPSDVIQAGRQGKVCVRDNLDKG